MASGVPPLEKWGGRVKPPPSPVKISGAKMSRYVKPFNLDFQESRFLNQNINKIKNLITIISPLPPTPPACHSFDIKN